jgi:GT2 family glycosyltransferase
MLIDNESVEPETLAYMAEFEGPVYRYPHPFNYARMMNLAAWATDAPYVIFLNNDTEIISKDWIEGMLAWCQQPDVGIVGTRILHMDGSVHHEGITLWRHNVTVAHTWYPGYHGLSYAVREVAAVTGACLMAKSSAFREIEGMDERMAVGYNDVDVCMRMRAAGYRVIYQGNVELYHHAGASRGRTTPLADEWFFLERWPKETTKDPYFKDNLLATWPVAILPP